MDAKQLAVSRITGRRRTIMQAAVFMMKSGLNKHEAPFLEFNEGKDVVTVHEFSSFKKALDYLTKARDSSALERVEYELQKEINTIREKEHSATNKKRLSMCLYALQNMILALSDYQFENGVENNFVPELITDQYKLMQLAAEKGYSWDSIKQTIHVPKYSEQLTEELSDWQFIDKKAIQNNFEDIKEDNYEKYDLSFRDKMFYDEEHGYRYRWDEASISTISEDEYQKYQADVIKEFGETVLTTEGKQLKNFREIYNFIKGKLYPDQARNKTRSEILAEKNNPTFPVNYPTLNKTAEEFVEKLIYMQRERTINKRAENTVNR